MAGELKKPCWTESSIFIKGNFVMKLLKSSGLKAAVLLPLFAASQAFAQTAPATNTTSKIDLTPITSVFKAGDVTTAVLAVAAVLAAIYATVFAAKMALRWIKGG